VAIATEVLENFDGGAVVGCLVCDDGRFPPIAVWGLGARAFHEVENMEWLQHLPWAPKKISVFRITNPRTCFDSSTFNIEV
jgi:hypothetical protein